MNQAMNIYCHCCEGKAVILGKYRVIYRRYDIGKSKEGEEIATHLFCKKCIADIKRATKQKEIHTAKAYIGFKGYIFIKDVDPEYYISLSIYSKPKNKSEEDIICEDLDYLF